MMSIVAVPFFQQDFFFCFARLSNAVSESLIHGPPKSGYLNFNLRESRVEEVFFSRSIFA
jgi:hypothetical protein